MKIYTVKTAAKELMISQALCYSLIAAGEIEHERHGLRRGVIRITEAALQRYRESKTKKARRQEAARPYTLKNLTMD